MTRTSHAKAKTSTHPSHTMNAPPYDLHPCPRSNLDWLETRTYQAAYLVLFGLKLAGSLGLAIYFFYRDILNINKPKAGVDVSNAALPVAIIFFLLQIGSILVFAVFLLVEVFRIKKKTVGATGRGKRLCVLCA
jgi:hypothetical protein